MLAVACCACAAERLHPLLCLQVRTTCAFSTFSLTGSSRSPTCQLLWLQHKAFGAMFFFIGVPDTLALFWYTVL